MRPFEIFRDTLGVPHVRAAGELDLAYGQGYVTARDRGWQVEVDRWRAEGRLAARFGAGGLEWDRFAVRVRLADTARRVHAALDAPEREWVAAYAAGVSAGLAAGGRDVPEMRALARACGGAHLPEHTPWPDWAPIGVFLVNHVLFSGFPQLLWREHVARTLGADPALFAGDGGPSSGSNAWALAGARTASGRPLLAGDPHRLLELPGVYQQVRLACEDYDVLGLAFPGVPGVLHFGHAEAAEGTASRGGQGSGASVAWGITNAMAHHVELFREDAESLRGAGSGAEQVPVRGGTTVDVEWVETARGPLVTDVHSVRWPVRATADAGVAAWRRLQRSRTARDVATAFAGWVDPVNRVLAADSSGEVLSLTAGRVPEREEHERALPLPAGSGSPEPPAWRTLPAPVRVSDLAVDANERPSRRETALGWGYAPHRADRIRALLAAPPGGGETPDTQARVHGDTCDGGAGELVAWLDDVVADTAEPAVVRAAGRLRAWAADGARMDAGSADAGTFARWRHALARRVAGHPALAALHAPHGLPPVFAPWLDVTARVGDGLARLLAAGRLVDGGPVIDARAEAVAALADVVAGGADRPWGELHALVPLHALAEASGVGQDDVPGVPEPLRVPVSGARDTVRCTGSVPGVTYAASRGSVARWVWDLSDRRRSRWGVPFGASGDPRSEHFADQHVTWAAAGTVEIETDWARLRPEPVEAP